MRGVFISKEDYVSPKDHSKTVDKLSSSELSRKKEIELNKELEMEISSLSSQLKASKMNEGLYIKNIELKNKEIYETEKTLEICVENLEDSNSNLEHSQRENESLADALEFYANQSNDKGVVARKALAINYTCAKCKKSYYKKECLCKD